jgi:hypothetical protein
MGSSIASSPPRQSPQRSSQILLAVDDDFHLSRISILSQLRILGLTRMAEREAGVPLPWQKELEGDAPFSIFVCIEELS